MSKAQPEYELQVKVCKYLDTRHPNVLYESALISQLRLTFPQQKRIKNVSKRGYFKPDIQILQASKDGKYIGFHLELKAYTPFLKDGVTLLKSEHLEDQSITLQDLRHRGYKAEFYWCYDTICSDLDNYILQA